MKKLSIIGRWFYEKIMLNKIDLETEMEDIYNKIENLCAYAYMWFLVLNEHNNFHYNVNKNDFFLIQKRLFKNNIYVRGKGWKIKDYVWWAKEMQIPLLKHHLDEFELDILNQVWDEYGKLYTSDELTDIVLQEELWNKHVDKKIGVFDKDPIMDWEVYMFILEKILIVRKD